MLKSSLKHDYLVCNSRDLSCDVLCCRQLRRWLSSHKKATRIRGISANFKGPKAPSQGTKMMMGQGEVPQGQRAEPVQRSHTSPRQQNTGVAVATVSRSITTPLLPTPPSHTHMHQLLTPPTLLATPHGHAHFQQPPSYLPPAAPPNHTHSPTPLLPFQQPQAHFNTPTAAPGPWRGQSSQPLLPTPITSRPHPASHTLATTPYSRQAAGPGPIRTKSPKVVSLVPTKQWTNFKFDRQAILNSYNH